MGTILWVIQIALGLMFLMAGAMKLMRTKEQVVASGDMMAWANDFSANNIKLIGLAEVLGAVGLVLPAATGILPILTPIAAVCLAIIMAGAAYTHYRRGEIVPSVIMNLVLLALLLFVAYGRFVAEPILAAA